MNVVKDRNKVPKELAVKLSNANVFYTEEYESYTKQRSQKIYYFWDDNYVVSLRIKKVSLLCAGVFDTEPFAISMNADINNQQIFIDKVCDEFKGLGIHWVVCAQTSSFEVYPHGAKTILKGNLFVDLSMSEEELFQRVHSKHRNSIRRSVRNGVTIRYGGKEYVDMYAALESATYDRSSNSGSGSKYYQKIAEFLPEHSHICLAYKDGIPQAGGVFLFNQKIGYYLHGASKDKPEPGAANLLLWTEMLKLKEQGVERFSFVGYGLNVEEGSKFEGIQRFKERFGGVLEKLFNFKYISSKTAYALYCFAMQLKAKKSLKKFTDLIDEQISLYPEFNEQGIKEKGKHL